MKNHWSHFIIKNSKRFLRKVCWKGFNIDNVSLFLNRFLNNKINITTLKQSWHMINQLKNKIWFNQEHASKTITCQHITLYIAPYTREQYFYIHTLMPQNQYPISHKCCEIISVRESIFLHKTINTDPYYFAAMYISK